MNISNQQQQQIELDHQQNAAAAAAAVSSSSLSSSAAVEGDTYFTVFGQSADGLPTPLAVMAIARWAIATVGAIFNSTLFYIIFRNRNSLSGTCNTLIGLNALCTALFEWSLGVGLFINLGMGQQFLTVRSCFFIQAVPILCRNLVISTLFAIAVDRLLSVTCTVWHLTRSQTGLYLAAVVGSCIGHGLFFLALVAHVVIRMPDFQVICLSSDDCYQGWEETILFSVNTAILLGLLVCYLLIWLFLNKVHADSRSDHSYTKRIAKSLTWTASVYSVGWLSYNLLRALLIPQLAARFLQPQGQAFLTFGSSILPYLAMAANAPLLCWFSRDYRGACVRTFSWMAKLGLGDGADTSSQRRPVNTVHPTPSNWPRTTGSFPCPSSRVRLEASGPFGQSERQLRARDQNKL